MSTLTLQPPTEVAQPKQDGVKVQEAIITPDIAEVLLQGNERNRHLRTKDVARYRDAILNGEWSFNGETIKVAADGTLLDGQHRLAAVVAAQRPIKTLLITGLPNSAQLTVDIGARRKLSDELAMRGESYPSTLAASLMLLTRIRTGDMLKHQAAPSFSQLLKLLDDEPGIRDSVAVGEWVRRRIYLPAPAMAVAHYLFSAIDHEDAAYFIDRVATGAELEHGHVILQLREAANRWHKDRGSLHSDIKMAYVIKAWNHWRDGADKISLKWRGGGAVRDEFPVPR